MYFTSMPNSDSHYAFITGINGFVGSYLAKHLSSGGWKVAGTDRAEQGAYADVEYFGADILDTGRLAAILAKIQPERVFHLAAVSIPVEADESPRLAMEVNVIGTVSLLDAVRRACPTARVLLVGSSKQYGEVSGPGAITEEAPCVPLDLYGISKFSAEMIGARYSAQFGLDVRFSRSFNHTGPGQPAGFVCSDWVKQTAAIELGLAPPRIMVGELEPELDFSDVADVVRAYDLILEKGRKGSVYNVCSGRSIALGDLLRLITSMTQKSIEVKQDPLRRRGHKTPQRVMGDRSLITRETGWVPEIPIERTMAALYRYWLKALADSTAPRKP